MAEAKCCFGCCRVRTGAVIVSSINMFICVIWIINILKLLNLWSYINNRSSYSKSSILDEDQFENLNYQQMQADWINFVLLSVVFLLFYTNLNLYKATRIRNTQSINYWLGTMTIFFIFFCLFTCYGSIKYGGNLYMPVGLPIIVIVAYQIYVIKNFYDFEVKFLATSERNVVVQPTSSGPTYVALPSQTVQNPTIPVQSGPYVIQQVHQPSLSQQSPYPQQTYQYQPQQPSHSHIALPITDQNTPHEYTNPPPYSPNYNMPEGPSVKQ